MHATIAEIAAAENLRHMNAKLEFTGISEIRLGSRGRIDAFHLSYVSPGANAGCHRPALLALALLIGGAQCHRQQHPHGLGPGRMAGLPIPVFVLRKSHLGS